MLCIDTNFLVQVFMVYRRGIIMETNDKLTQATCDLEYLFHNTMRFIAMNYRGIPIVPNFYEEKIEIYLPDFYELEELVMDDSIFWTKPRRKLKTAWEMMFRGVYKWDPEDNMPEDKNPRLSRLWVKEKTFIEKYKPIHAYKKNNYLNRIEHEQKRVTAAA